MADLFDNLRRDGTSSSDVAHEFWNVVDRVGRAVGEQEDRGASWERVQHLEIDFVSARARRRRYFVAALHPLRIQRYRGEQPTLHSAEYSCTNLHSFLTLSTGVSGRMPWPRLKMW